MRDFIDKVRQRLRINGWTITRLAKEAGVGRPYLHRVLAGDHQPTMKNAEKIAHALGMEIRTVVCRKKSERALDAMFRK